MVSFSCEGCGDILTKKKLDPHRNRCRGATFTCIDCMVHFPGTEYRWHTSCMSEEQKYQGALYKDKKNNNNNNNNHNNNNGNNNRNNNQPSGSAPMPHAMAQPAYVESVVEDGEWRHYDQESDDDNYPVRNLPEAPTPPSAVERPANVFDFLIENPTPTASHVSLPATANVETQLVRFDPDANGANDDLEMNDDTLVPYDGPVPVSNFETPAPKTARRKVKDADKDATKDKKRKRLHIETDHTMVDAPPVMHSGLTGGLNRLMSRPAVFPPSPDYSGDNKAPPTPIKKTKAKKSSKSPGRSTTEALSNGFMAMITGPKAKPMKKKTKTSSSSTKKKTVKRLEGAKEPKLLEYRPSSKDGETKNDGQMIVFKPSVDHFLSFVNKGPESERGCSLNKALKRYHRDRSSSGVSLSKAVEEKELFKSLRMKKNDRGEIVLFCI
ncbi:hypothetical protein QBC44DRAFT_344432 [Cladorrhinum sp. PSN332]|nr:hypothetical protein QBC44DRAFT_344432 [Cladorrhinum sp. PSN332]